MAHRDFTRTQTETSGSNNRNAHPPEPDSNLDIFASTSLKDFKDKETLLQNIGYLRGIRVDNNASPRSLRRRVAKFAGAEPPFVQETNDFLTETTITKTERDTNYIHHGWSIDATSTISPWTSSRIAVKNQPNAEGTWVTRRTLVRRFVVQVSLEDLAPVPEFKAEIEAALRKPTIFQQFQSVYRALHEWGDVVPLELEMGISLAFTDTETNMSQLPAAAKWTDTQYLATIRTARITREDGTDYLEWDNCLSPKRIISPLQWRQIRIARVTSTIELLPAEVQSQLSELYGKRLSYFPAITIGPSDGTSRTQDDTPSASRQVSSVVIYASDWIRSMRFLYVDKMSSSKHEGTEINGSEHKFVLTNGEYITEMLIWKSDWVDGLQFVTNFGRCSPYYGGSGHTPTVVRSKGGVLVGVLSLVKKHECGYLFRRVQGIWRHDVFNKVPKEDDVFSEYFGSKSRGRPFNDRTIVQNSDMGISKIEVWCDSVIDCLQFTYVSKMDQGTSESQTERHGGQGKKRPPFELEQEGMTVSGSLN